MLWEPRGFWNLKTSERKSCSTWIVALFLEHLIKLTLQGYLVHTAQECANPQNALNNSKPYEIKKSHKPVKEKEEYHHNHCDHPQFFLLFLLTGNGPYHLRLNKNKIHELKMYKRDIVDAQWYFFEIRPES